MRTIPIIAFWIACTIVCLYFTYMKLDYSSSTLSSPSSLSSSSATVGSPPGGHRDREKNQSSRRIFDSLEIAREKIVSIQQFLTQLQETVQESQWLQALRESSALLDQTTNTAGTLGSSSEH
jgi:hypothetical protein